MYIVLLILSLLISYLLGSINFAIIISKVFMKSDVREHGSGNAGMTNVMRSAGKLPGIFTLLGDALKGAVAVALGRFIFFPQIFESTGNEMLLPVYGAFLCGIFCMLGHIFPIFFGFRGGKGVATTLGIVLMIDWRVALCALTLFVVLFLFTKIVSISSMAAAASVSVFSALFFPLLGYAPNDGRRLFVVILGLIFALIIIVKHKENIVRLINGEEKKLTSKKGDEMNG